MHDLGLFMTFYSYRKILHIIHNNII